MYCFFQSRSDSRVINVRSCVRSFVMPFQLYHHSTFSSINFLTNQLYSSLARLIATFKTFSLVSYKRATFWHLLRCPLSQVATASVLLLALKSEKVNYQYCFHSRFIYFLGSHMVGIHNIQGSKSINTKLPEY